MGRPSAATFWDLSYRDGSFREHWEPLEVPPELVRQVEDGPAPAGASALDVGCGSGVEALYLAHCGYRVVGLDLSPSALAVARRRSLPPESPRRGPGHSRLGRDRPERSPARASPGPLALLWCAGRAGALPLGSGSVHLALDRGLIHVVERDARPAYAREIHRVLAPGGRFLVRGAREDDEEQGLVGFAAAELDRLFPPPRFRRGPVRRMSLEARSGDLEGHLAVLRKVG